ncbi:MAG TPA: hypothetical protein VGD97_11635 [Lacunisphaera sp.]
MNRPVIQAAVFALSLVFPAFLFSDTSGPSYQIRHVAGLDEWTLIFPAEKGKEAYVDYRLALEIIEIECDGKKLVPALVDGFLHLGYETYPATDPQVVYMSRFYELRTAVFEGAKLNPEKVWEYPISKDAKRVVVKYRVRYPKSGPSDIITVISVSRPVSRKKD